MKNKKRINFEFPNGVFESVQRIQAVTQASSFHEVVRRAIIAYEKQIGKGDVSLMLRVSPDKAIQGLWYLANYGDKYKYFPLIYKNDGSSGRWFDELGDKCNEPVHVYGPIAPDESWIAFEDIGPRHDTAKFDNDFKSNKVSEQTPFRSARR